MWCPIEYLERWVQEGAPPLHLIACHSSASSKPLYHAACHLRRIIRRSTFTWQFPFRIAEARPEGAIAAAAGQYAAGLWLSHQAEYMARLPPRRYVIPCTHHCPPSLDAISLLMCHPNLPSYHCIPISHPMQEPGQQLMATVMSDSVTGS